MYNCLKNVQIIISLLKEYKIKNLVLSPGSRNVPFVHSVEQDNYFTCYSMVDERSAGYFALGLAEALNEPVLLSCTSATATCNYLPAIEEASKNNIQLIALTADRNPYYREQLENQMIMQPNMYGKYCKKAVDLPTVKNREDEKYCERLVNEALLELNHNGKGPVQINFPAYYGFNDFSVKELPKCRVIHRLIDKEDDKWKVKYEQLKKAQKIMLLFGENDNCDEEKEQLIKEMFETFNCIISVEHMSNVHIKEAIRTYVITEGMNSTEMREVLPDIIITFGNNFSSEIKHGIRDICDQTNMQHWRVALDGEVVDPFMCLNTIFECDDKDFMKIILSYKNEKNKNNLQYYKIWQEKIANIKLPEEKFSNFHIINKLTKILPSNSIVHLSILNSIRITNLFDLDPTIKVYANIGAYGIDGSLSTFLGNAYSSDELSFLIIGDLSFIYDLNATLNLNLDKNIRILIINNNCGGEFHHIYNDLSISNIDLHIAAGHNFNLKSWCESLDVDYYSAKNFEELDKGFGKFIKKQNKAQILEVFTDADIDTQQLHDYFRINKKAKSNKIIRLCKKILRGIKIICKKICLKILTYLE